MTPERDILSRAAFRLLWSLIAWRACGAGIKGR
jgi:hypothetical protein